MRQARFGALALAMAGMGLSTYAPAFSLLGTKWGLGGGNADINTGNTPSPGQASWSIMGAGLSMSSINDNHGASLTVNFGSLIGTSSTVEEEAAISAALATWSAVSGFSSLGKVADGGSNAGATNALGGHLGDLRFGAGGGFGGELAHAWQPGTELDFALDWNKGGDVHFDTSWTWVDDPNDTPGLDDFDLQTVLLHEIGHSLGLGHSSNPDSVMFFAYQGGRRTLHADDIAGIQALYGPSPVPEPATMAVLGAGALALIRRRRSK